MLRKSCHLRLLRKKISPKNTILAIIHPVRAFPRSENISLRGLFLRVRNIKMEAKPIPTEAFIRCFFIKIRNVSGRQRYEKQLKLVLSP